MVKYLKICKNTIDSYFLGSASIVKSKGSSGINEYVSSLFDQSLTWKDVDWLKSITKLPIIVKGVLTVEAAVSAYEHGASAVIVSNHGARQLDGVPATIDVLQNIGNSDSKTFQILL
jgi:(S)-2-hydroxy-acid oxidase